MTEIPIQNLYYLLCYAWDRLEERDRVPVDAASCPDVLNLLAKVLANGTSRLLRRGLDRDYVPVEEVTPRLRGRICFAEAVARCQHRQAALPCRFDEFSHDVLHNRILYSTLLVLLRTNGLTRENQDRLRTLCQQMGEITPMAVRDADFGRVRLHRNNQFYDFLLKICRIALGSLLPSEGAGRQKFVDFLRDEKKMSALFEEFVRNFYRTHARRVFPDVRRTEITWRLTPGDADGQALLPKMQTDVTLIGQGKTVIIDCKYYSDALQHHHETDKFLSGNLYQIHAYLTNHAASDKYAQEELEVFLLYPTTTTPLSHRFTTPQGHVLCVHTVNLDQPWEGIHRDLLGLVGIREEVAAVS